MLQCFFHIQIHRLFPFCLLSQILLRQRIPQVLPVLPALCQCRSRAICAVKSEYQIQDMINRLLLRSKGIPAINTVRNVRIPILRSPVSGNLIGIAAGGNRRMTAETAAARLLPLMFQRLQRDLQLSGQCADALLQVRELATAAGIEDRADMLRAGSAFALHTPFGHFLIEENALDLRQIAGEHLAAGRTAEQKLRMSQLLPLFPDQ